METADVTVQAAIARRLTFLDTLAWEVRTTEGSDPAMARDTPRFRRADVERRHVCVRHVNRRRRAGRERGGGGAGLDLCRQSQSEMAGCASILELTLCPKVWADPGIAVYSLRLKEMLDPQGRTWIMSNPYGWTSAGGSHGANLAARQRAGEPYRSGSSGSHGSGGGGGGDGCLGSLLSGLLGIGLIFLTIIVIGFICSLLK